MLSWLIRRRITAFERAFDYDAAYAHEMADVNRRALFALNRAMELGAVRDGVPTDVLFAAKLSACLHEDCGPCVQLVAQMALNAGVSPDVVAAIVQGAWTKLPEAVALSAQFARATLDRQPEADTLREALEQRFGRKGLVSIACAITAARIYPGLKYALGYGQHCARVRIGSQTVLPQAHGNVALAPAAS